MNDYSTALKAYLDRSGKSQQALADEIKTSQAAVARYASGDRLPDKIDTARRIEAATGGEVSIELWQKVQLGRLGLDAAA